MSVIDSRAPAHEHRHRPAGRADGPRRVPAPAAARGPAGRRAGVLVRPHPRADLHPHGPPAGHRQGADPAFAGVDAPAPGGHRCRLVTPTTGPGATSRTSSTCGRCAPPGSATRAASSGGAGGAGDDLRRLGDIVRSLSADDLSRRAAAHGLAGHRRPHGRRRRRQPGRRRQRPRRARHRGGARSPRRPAAPVTAGAAGGRRRRRHGSTRPRVTGRRRPRPAGGARGASPRRLSCSSCCWSEAWPWPAVETRWVGRGVGRARAPARRADRGGRARPRRPGRQGRQPAARPVVRRPPGARRLLRGLADRREHRRHGVARPGAVRRHLRRARDVDPTAFPSSTCPSSHRTATHPLGRQRPAWHARLARGRRRPVPGPSCGSAATCACPTTRRCAAAARHAGPDGEVVALFCARRPPARPAGRRPPGLPARLPAGAGRVARRPPRGPRGRPRGGRGRRGGARSGADAVFVAEDFGPYGSRRDAAVADALAGRGASLRAGGVALRRGARRVVDKAGDAVQGVHAVLAGLARRTAGPTPPAAARGVRWAAGVDGDGIPDCPAGRRRPARAGRGGGQAGRPPVLGRRASTDYDDAPQPPRPRRHLAACRPT